jgi:hypothetical protein
MSTPTALRRPGPGDRVAGLALILASCLSLAGGLLHPVVAQESHSLAAMTRPDFPLAHVLLLLGGVCLLFGLPALYARIAPRTGVLGLLGVGLYFLANAAFVVPFAFYEAVIVPTLAADPATQSLVLPDGAVPAGAPFVLFQGIGGPSVLLGLLVLGIATLRARLFPVWAGALLVLAPLVLLLPVPENPILTGLLIEGPRGLAVAAIGWSFLAVRRSERPAVAQPLAA